MENNLCNRYIQFVASYLCYPSTNLFICNHCAVLVTLSCHLFVRFLGVNLSKGKLLKIQFDLTNPSFWC